MKLQKSVFESYLDELESDYEIVYLSDIGNTRIIPHSHPYYEMYLLVTNEVAYQTSDGIFMLHSGDTIFVNKNITHCPIVLNSSALYERIALNVRPEKLKSLSRGGIDLAECFTSGRHNFFRFPYSLQNSIRLILGKILSLRQTRPFGHDLLMDAYLTELFVTITEYIHYQNPLTLMDELKPYQLLAIIDQYIMEKLDDQIQVGDLATFVCMSKFNFMRTFKNLTGKTVYQYIIHKRLEAAESLIKSGTDFFSAAQMCGFSDYSCFYRSFINKHKMSPSKYYGFDSPSPKSTLIEVD